MHKTVTHLDVLPRSSNVLESAPVTITQSSAADAQLVPTQPLGRPPWNEAFPDDASRPTWERRLALWIAAVDAAVIAAVVVPTLRLDALAVAAPLPAVAAVLVATWILALQLGGSYNRRVLGQGTDEYTRVLRATWRVAAVTALAAVVAPVQVAPTFVLAAAPLTGMGLLAVRAGGHRCVGRLHRRGIAVRRVLVVGPAHAAASMIRTLETDRGFKVVALCTGGLVQDMVTNDTPTEIDVDEVLRDLKRARADTVAVAGTKALSEGFLARLAWTLGGSGVDVLVPPAITDSTGPRIHFRPASRLSMMYVDEPELRGMSRIAKGTFDRVVAFVLLIILLPSLVVVAAAVKLSSPGSVLFRQRRAGRAGEYFGIWKFRTMHADASRFSDGYDLAMELGALGEKRADDPRVTRIGRFLRATSLDELPQLFNVLMGQMSLVGPRPLRKHEVDSFAHHEMRRHMVKPGMTGLWQVSGRSDMGWQERLQLDLHYVENWSLVLDLVILLRTLPVVLRRTGAY
jgi:exopolysaccharide biosynthesis polyprenyl glycosylphosphotransferase